MFELDRTWVFRKRAEKHPKEAEELDRPRPRSFERDLLAITAENVLKPAHLGLC
jgi:hypothetical protein